MLDFTQYLAGPTVTRLMAELGADIVKVEQAPGGDPSRYLPFQGEGRSHYFVQQNRGKRSLCLDFDRPEALDVLRDLVAAADVVVENYGPGVLEKRGLDYASLRAINPRLVMASISAFGRRNSPLAHKVGYDTIAQAFSGFMHMTGERDRPPQFVGVGFADVSAGVHALTGLALALFHRERTGRGQWVDISMIDCLFHSHEMNVQLPAANPRVEPARAAATTAASRSRPARSRGPRAGSWSSPSSGSGRRSARPSAAPTCSTTPATARCGSGPATGPSSSS